MAVLVFIPTKLIFECASSAYESPNQTRNEAQYYRDRNASNYTHLRSLTEEMQNSLLWRLGRCYNIRLSLQWYA